MAVCRMSDIFDQHAPVLLQEAVDHLIVSPDGIYLDATFGRGSHSQAILNRLSAKGRLIALDKDQDAVAFAKEYFSHDPRFSIVHCSFARLQTLFNSQQLVGQFSGILFDLGVSSPQLDNPARGFSFSKAGELDMRMDQTKGTTAKTWLATVEEKELANVLWTFGEERYARRIAKAIISARNQFPITTTLQLADIIKQAVPVKKKQDRHPATRSFQAIRIVVNQELIELELGLQQALACLAIGGRLAVISFHSLEDRIVKQFIREQEKGVDLPRGLPIKGSFFIPRLKSIGKPIKPTLQEININPRARSAILRIAEKQS